ncbi:hypothetical protein [Halotia branconii]|uniref:Uncharacterized protein n=1 Tax=Halotia branconii CENA392 TaxID=1539056 RepID=A0AAJ6P7H4_9CYAN|nr:hypothetical protein [Halotia branconii]WGV23744.1 hypothetical protein QI031_18225 [Halotia branconii CENA392]
MKIKIWPIALTLFLCFGYIVSQVKAAKPIKNNGMDEQFRNEATKQFTRPWSARRGIESIDRNAEVILVKVPLDQLSNALAKKSIESRYDVMGKEIEASGTFVFAYQLVGHPWSIIVSDTMHLQSTELAQLSKQLEKPVIKLNVSDTSGTIGYDLFEDGRLVEYFQGEEGELADDANEHGIQPQRYLLSPYPDDEPETQQTAYFWSLRRQLIAKEIGNIWSFTNQFLIEYDAFDPAIDSSYLLGESSLRRGDRYQVQNQGFTLVLGYGQKITSVPDLVRVDYFKLGN